MKSAKRLAYAWAALGVLASSASWADAPRWRTLETLSLPIDATHPPNVLTVERSDDDARVRVTVKRPSGETIPEFFGTGLARLSQGVAAELLATNRLRSGYAFAAPKLDRFAGRRVLILLGDSGEPGPPTLHVLMVGPTTFETYGAGPLYLTKIVRSRLGVELIGRPPLSEVVGRCRSTYDPYAVLAFVGGKDPSLAYAPALSRAYNRANYVWAGPKFRTDVTVVTCGVRARLLKEPAA